MEKSKTYLLGNKDLYVIQDTDSFTCSLDSVLLPNFITINKKIKKIMDIGTGTAPIPLILSKRTTAKIIGVEIQKDIYELAVESIKINKLEDQIEIANKDIRDLYKEIESDTFDAIICNPPYFKMDDDSNVNQDTKKTIARHEKELTLENIMIVARKLLKNGGYLALVHRPDRLLEIVDTMRNNNIEPKRIKFVHPFKNSSANILLIEGVKNGKVGLKIDEPLYSHDKSGKYSKDINKFLSR